MSEPLLTPQDLESGGYETVIVAAPDMHGRLFGRRLTVASFLQALEDGVDVCTSTLAWDVHQAPLTELEWTGFHTGWHDLNLKFDLSTLRPLAWLEGVAVCIADCLELSDGSPVEISPRAILRRQVEALRAQGLSALVGTELEFYLFRGTPRESRLDGFRSLEPTTLRRADYSIQPANAYEEFFRGVREKLAASGIEIVSGQAEWGLGQWEMTLPPGDPIDAADRHTLYKMAIQDMAAVEGYSATFMPRPMADQAGSSCHVHASLLDADGAPAFWDPNAPYHMSEVMRHAMGGLIERIPDLVAFFAPTVNSYRRLLQPDFAGRGATWGFDNRTTSLRVLGHSERQLRFEFRLPGSDANPYLALAAMLAAMRDGLERTADPGEPVTGNAYELEVAEIPSHLGEAAAGLRESAFARAAFGDKAVGHYASAAESEWQQFLLAVTDWELDRYFEI